MIKLEKQLFVGGQSYIFKFFKEEKHLDWSFNVLFCNQISSITNFKCLSPHLHIAMNNAIAIVKKEIQAVDNNIRNEAIKMDSKLKARPSINPLQVAESLNSLGLKDLKFLKKNLDIAIAKTKKSVALNLMAEHRLTAYERNFVKIILMQKRIQLQNSQVQTAINNLNLDKNASEVPIAIREDKCEAIAVQLMELLE